MTEGINFDEITTKCLLCATVMILGLFYYIPGPTFLELTAQVDGELTPTLLLFTSRAVGKILGFIVGSLMFLVILRSNQVCMVMFLSMFLSSVTAFLIPLIRSKEIIMMIFFIAGFLIASTEIGVSAMCFNVFASETFIMIIFVFYDLGAMVTPLLPDISHEANRTTTILSNVTVIYTQIWKAQYSTSLAHSYIFISSLLFVLSLIWMTKHCLTSFNEALMRKILKTAQEDVSALSSITVIFTSILSFISGWIDCAYIHVLPTYCMLMLDMSPEKSMQATLMFLSFHTLARIPMTLKVPRPSMVILGILFLLLGTFFLYIVKMSLVLFYFSNGMIGFGAGPLFPVLVHRLMQTSAPSYRNIVPLFVMRSLAELGGPLILSIILWKSTKHRRLFLLVVSLLYLFWLCLYFTVYATCKKLNEPSEVAVPEAIANSVRRYKSIHSPKLASNEKTVKEKECASIEQISRGEEILANISPIKDKIHRSQKSVQRTLESLVYSHCQIKDGLTPSKVELKGKKAS